MTRTSIAILELAIEVQQVSQIMMIQSFELALMSSGSATIILSYQKENKCLEGSCLMRVHA